LIGNSALTLFFDIVPAIIVLDLAAHEENMPIFCAGADVDAAGLSYVPPRLHASLSPTELSWRLVRAALVPLLVNLMLLPDSDHPELVRHIRMAWRRFLRALRLSITVCNLDHLPDLSSLHFLMHQLGQLRDTEVARLEVLDQIKTRFILKYVGQESSISELEKSLEMTAQLQRQAIREWLLDTSMQDTVWALTLWAITLFTVAKTKSPISDHPAGLSDWATLRIRAIHKKFERSQDSRRHAQTRHRTRIWAKRLRFAIEDLEGLLHPPPDQWLKKAIQVQRREGEFRDLQVLVELAERYGSWSLALKLRKFVMSGQIQKYMNHPADPDS
jgi:CHAD domain-containing protein